ncbi:MAG TPA: alanine--glyoxylate aminotransferase family protein [Anaerolineales bacterium]|nr:alanine--glyoxylate aminotransferase family protein [Anaerolineales bacterium]
MKIEHIERADPPSRILLGPGPGMPHPRVLTALMAPTLSHLDPEMLRIFAEEQDLLRFVFQTQNAWTFALSGTGTAGMEAALANLIEPGDAVLACINGYFGARLAEVAQRLGATVDRLERPPGEIFAKEDVVAALDRRRYKLLTLVHAETSTGTEQKEIGEIAEAAHANGALLVLDTVTSLGGIPVEIDAWDVDVAYSASQKNLGAPSGLAPITIGDRARDVIEKRKAPISSFNLDLNLYWNYWNEAHAYHHTASASLHYALHEGLRVIAGDGLERTFARYRINAESLWSGLEQIGVPPFIAREYRLPSLTTARVPPGVDAHLVRRRLLEQYSIEIAAGFGALKDRVWRIGLMGYSSRVENIKLFLAALEELVG